ncbi:MAG: glycosyltransferase family 2 protein [Candidatus Aenigmarchaeota archaeon]|nr:glycosyltransferase family 2 protein [Candidatus Aenigmarchaeota archaeon]
MENKEVCAIVVTYNRKKLLIECLIALMKQTKQLDAIYIIDNASTDGTHSYLNEKGYINEIPPHNSTEPWEKTLQISLAQFFADKTIHTSSNLTIHYVRMCENTGGAGGFYEGVKRGCEKGYDWLWLMDDDAKPKKNALEKLLEINPIQSNVYGSVAAYYENDYLKICSPCAVTQEKENQTRIELQKDLTKLQEVNSIPFLGFFISSKLVETIGLPDRNFFISADDVEYCLRAKRNGSKIIFVKDSIILHPFSECHIFKLVGRKFYYLRLTPWRRYYDVRNKILIARHYYKSELYTKTLPGLLVRLIATILYEKDSIRQIKFFCKAVKDGMLGINGRKVLPGSM